MRGVSELFYLDLFSSSNDFTLGGADNATLDALSFVAGYVFEYDKFYIAPKIGYSRWEVQLTEGRLLSPGEEKDISNDGYDVIFLVDAGYRFNKLFGMSLTYKNLDFDYGTANSYILNFDFFYKQYSSATTRYK